MSEPTPYPLKWPLGWPRTREPKKSVFAKRTLIQAYGALHKELLLLGVHREIVSSNVLLRMDGRPRADGHPPYDTGVAVYFWRIGDPRMNVLACDRWQTVQENLRAITLHIEALRAVERYGVGTIERVLEGYALPASSSVERPWWQVLGVSEFATQDEIQAAFREKAREVHPDRGGSTDAMAALNQARDRALAEWEELKRKGIGR